MSPEELLSKVHAEIMDYPKLALSVDTQNAIRKFYNPDEHAWTCECGFTNPVSAACAWCGFKEGYCKCGLHLLDDNTCPMHW